ncbi:hypothetical protein Nepgr_031526 [Nepenthes gracilis]|uniref:Uncharacterized protein n=1 Tax=Nepenthes gracilis TaxID=150966 RepID=A0AAD3Y579_NEPGR|nr:hypothetical protein Nepgr_031526 [Nepenthes gracilis]
MLLPDDMFFCQQRKKTNGRKQALREGMASQSWIDSISQFTTSGCSKVGGRSGGCWRRMHVGKERAQFPTPFSSFPRNRGRRAEPENRARRERMAALRAGKKGRSFKYTYNSK